MAYPWYSVLRLAGSNQSAAVSILRHCETKERRLKLDIIAGGRKRSATVNSEPELLEAAEGLMKKFSIDGDAAAILADVREIADRLTNGY